MAQSATKNQGFSIIEIILAITIFAIFSIGIVYLSLDSIQRDSEIELNNVALLYAQEGIEATRNIRDRSYLLLSNGDHGLNFANETWTFVQAPETIDTFYSRTITIYDVYRDLSGNIASSGTIDPDTKLITSQVTWLQKGVFQRDITITTYLTDWTGDDWIKTTCTEFDLGTYTNTEIVTTDAPPADNCSVQLSGTAGGGEFLASADLGDHGHDVHIEGTYAYVANKKTATGFTIVDVTDPANPSILSNLDVNGKGRYITKQGNHVYEGIENSNKGLAIVDASNPLSPNLVTSLDVGGEGNSLVASGNYLYMGVNNDLDSFKIIDISNPQSPLIISSLDFNDKVQSVYLNNNYAYLGMEDDDDGFKIVDISNVNSPTLLASLDIGEEVNAIVISGLFAFVGTEDDDASLTVINISNPATPVEVASLDLGEEIEALTIEGDYLYAAIDDSNIGLAAVNISNPLVPVLEYNLDIQGKGKGIDSDANTIYIGTHTSNKGLVMVGTSVGGVIASGSYDSEIFDTASSTTRYNYIEWESSTVPGSTVKFQIRTADSSSNIASATWVGSDGISGTYYDNSKTKIITSPSASGLQFFQFKAVIDSDGENTPTIESVTVNYTP